MRDITVAEHAGFCFGVSRAVNLVEGLIREADGKKRICTLGHLIHNPHYLSYLESQGVSSVEEDELDALYAGTGEERPTVLVIRTHGIPRRLSEKLDKWAKENPYFTAVDATCPFVKKIHNIVSANASLPLVVFGDETHPEVQGILSYSDAETKVVSSADEVAALDFGEKEVILVSQTTQKLTEWKFCQNKMKDLFTNAKIYDTICSTTENRQVSAKTLAEQVDAMLVIGGAESSNSKKLYMTAKEVCENTWFIESPEEARSLPVKPGMKLGITAGASTPSSLIEEVYTIMAEEKITNVGEATDAEDFAGMLEGSFKTINTGEVVHGVIQAVSETELQVDLGAKFTGIISYSEVTDDPAAKLTEMFHIGDEVDAKVIKVSERDGVATLSKKSVDNIAKGMANWNEVVEASENNTVLEGVVAEAVKGGVVMNYKGIRVFIPASQSGVPKDGDLSVLVGQTVRVKIIDLNEQRRRAVASIRLVQREERKAREAEFWQTIEVGKEYDGVVKSMTSYGAFVDLGGVDGMVHCTELSWRRVRHPSEVVSIGETVHVFVKDVDVEQKRISLGYKTEATNPWNIFTGKYSVGDVASVKVVSLMPFGAFAEVVPGADGLIHISQIADRKLEKPGDVLEIGQVVDAKIIDIDYDRRKISLSIRALLNEENGDGEED